MDQWKLILLYIIFIFVFIVLAFFSFFFLNKLFHESQNNENGIFLLEIDIKNKRMRKNNLSFQSKNKRANNEINKLFSDGWFEIKEFMQKLDSKSRQKWQESIIYCFDYSSNTNLSISPKFKKIKNTYLWNINFVYVNENTINAFINWSTRNEYLKVEPKIIQKEEIIKNSNNCYTIFISFSLVNPDKEVTKFFIKEMDKIINYKFVNYFCSSNIVIALIRSNDYQKLQKIKNLIINRIDKKTFNSEIFNYYDAISVVETKEIKNEQEFSKVMTRVLFSLIKSKQNNEIFTFNLKNIFYNEFEEFKESILDVNNIIINKKFEIEKIDVKRIIDDKPVFLYIRPKFKIEENIWTNYILKNQYLNKKINNVFFGKLISVIDEKLNNVLVNIDINTIDNYFDKICKKNNVTYIIDLNENSNVSNLISLLDLIKKYKIQYTFRINSLSSSILSIIKNSKPQMIILSGDLSKEKEYFKPEDWNKISLSKIELIVLCERQKIIPIFENINSNEKNKIKSIGSKENYYYNII